METNTKVKALKRCSCRQCKASKGSDASKRERIAANRRIRRMFSRLLSRDDSGMNMVQSMERS